MGFGSLNGASAVALSALGKYGLIESVGDKESRVSDLAMRILFPETPEEKSSALADAAGRPVLFSEIHEKWPDRPPSDENLRSYLIRKGFSQGALDQVIQIYRETIDVAFAKSWPQNPPPAIKPVEEQMSNAPMQQSLGQPTLPPGRPFSVAFDGTVLTGTLALRSPKDIDRLVKVLNAQKAAMEAMQEDGEEEEPASEIRLAS